VSLTSAAFIVAFLMGAFLALFRHPIFGLLTYVGVFYLSPADRWWGEDWMREVRWSLIAAGITLLGMLIHRRKLQAAAFWGRGPVVGMMLFVAWLAAQLIWVPEWDQQSDLLTMYAKFVIVLFMIFRCVDSPKGLMLLLWAHMLGCLYLGWIVFAQYGGGRFEDFGGPGLSEANSGGLALATGVLTGAGLFLAGRLPDRAAVTLAMPLVLNGLVATISRSGFLAIAIGGVAFNLFTPTRLRGRVLALSALGLVLMLLVTNANFWARIGSIKYAGAEVQDVDTGGGRLEIIQAQWRMFKSHPLGCGHRCTALLSASYLDDKYLTTGAEGERARASHNTFVSLLVEQGIPGAIFYVAMLVWLTKNLVTLWWKYRTAQCAEAAFVPAVAAVLVAITIGDMFVDFLKFEIRIWFLAIVMVLVGMPSTPLAEAEQSAVASGS
jgi:O-antigen ligase